MTSSTQTGSTEHIVTPLQDDHAIGNESVPKIIINDTIRLFFKTAISILVISNHNGFRVLSDKIASVYINRKIYIKNKIKNILALEMANPGKQHCANCIGSLSFPIATGNMLRKFGRV